MAFTVSFASGTLAVGAPERWRWMRAVRGGFLAVQLLALAAVAALVVS
ncbi:hypothetical protein [Streptomyces abikoensis]